MDFKFQPWILGDTLQAQNIYLRQFFLFPVPGTGKQFQIINFTRFNTVLTELALRKVNAFLLFYFGSQHLNLTGAGSQIGTLTQNRHFIETQRNTNGMLQTWEQVIEGAIEGVVGRLYWLDIYSNPTERAHEYA